MLKIQKVPIVGGGNPLPTPSPRSGSFKRPRTMVLRAVVFFIPMKILILGPKYWFLDVSCKNTENGKSNLAALMHDARDCPGYTCISRSVCTIRRHVGGQHDVSENALYVEGIWELGLNTIYIYTNQLEQRMYFSNSKVNLDIQMYWDSKHLKCTLYTRTCTVYFDMNDHYQSNTWKVYYKEVVFEYILFVL